MLHRWIVDVAFIRNRIPRHPVLGRIVVNGSNVGDVRAAVDCVSYSLSMGLALAFGVNFFVGRRGSGHGVRGLDEG